LIALFLLELRMFLRDYRTLFFSIILPVILMPVLFSLVQTLQHKKLSGVKEANYTYAFRTNQEREMAHRYRLDLKGLREVSPGLNPDSLLAEGRLDLILGSNLGADANREPLTANRTLEKSPPPVRIFSEKLGSNPQFLVYYSVDHERSGLAKQKVQRQLSQQIRKNRFQQLQRLGLPQNLGELKYEDICLSSDDPKEQRKLAPFICVMLSFLILGGASVAALDSLAGERERGSLETLLVSNLPHAEIVSAKLAAVVVLSLAIAAFEIANLYLFAHLGWVQAPELLAMRWTPELSLLLLALTTLLAWFLSSILIFVSASCSSFKTAQMSLFPVIIVAMALVLIGSVEELKLNGFFALVPLSGLSMAFRDLLSWDAQHPIHWLGMLMVVVVHLFLIGFIHHQTVLRISPENEGGQARIDSIQEQRRDDVRRDLPWLYGTLLAGILIVPSNFPVLATLNGQVFWNQGLMVVGPCLLLWRHGVALREGLRLTPCKLRYFLIAAILAPLIQLCAQSSAILTAEYLPVPQEMVKQMTAMLLPENTSTLTLVLMLALSPAICEEMAFRGVMLYSLSRWGESRLSRAQKLKLSLVVGLCFGFFHLSLARILPTAIAGFAITLLALESGSIFPGMVLHFLNNAIAVVSHRNSIELSDLPSWIWPAAWMLTIFIFVLLTRTAKTALPKPKQPIR
jgi:sodium transport system permease protein